MNMQTPHRKTQLGFEPPHQVTVNKTAADQLSLRPHQPSLLVRLAAQETPANTDGGVRRLNEALLDILTNTGGPPAGQGVLVNLVGLGNQNILCGPETKTSRSNDSTAHRKVQSKKIWLL